MCACLKYFQNQIISPDRKHQSTSSSRRKIKANDKSDINHYPTRIIKGIKNIDRYRLKAISSIWHTWALGL